jgi:hypothetical protein
VAAVAVMVAGCSSQQTGTPTVASSSVSPSSTSSVQAAGPCTLPHFGDLVEWRHQPGKTDRAYRLSDVDVKECQPTLNNWTAGLSQVPGVCYMIGWADDNVGYNVNAVPAPPLRKAMDKVGDAC